MPNSMPITIDSLPSTSDPSESDLASWYTLGGMHLKKLGVAIAATTLALLAPLTACSSDSSDPATQAGTENSEAAVEVVEQPESPQRVTAETFAAAVATPGVITIDVRTPEEFAEGHIEGALNYNVEGPDFADQIATLDPAGTYAVYCRSGNRSQPAVNYMAGLGINAIFELETGIVGWEDAGLPTVS